MPWFASREPSGLLVTTIGMIFYLGSTTESMTCTTPLLASTSALITFAPSDGNLFF